jgi:hypothetical protein
MHVVPPETATTQVTVVLTVLYRRMVLGVRTFGLVLFGRSQMHGGVVIRGDDAFVRATIEVLELLKAKTPDVYALLEKHIGYVVSGKPSGVVVRGLARFPTTMVLIGPA